MSLLLTLSASGLQYSFCVSVISLAATNIVCESKVRFLMWIWLKCFIHQFWRHLLILKFLAFPQTTQLPIYTCSHATASASGSVPVHIILYYIRYGRIINPWRPLGSYLYAYVIIPSVQADYSIRSVCHLASCYRHRLWVQSAVPCVVWLKCFIRQFWRHLLILSFLAFPQTTQPIYTCSHATASASGSVPVHIRYIRYGRIINPWRMREGYSSHSVCVCVTILAAAITYLVYMLKKGMV
jgi:hypothetical protein